MADKKYSGKSSSDSKSNRKSKRSFSKDSSSFSKKDDSKPRRSYSDKKSDSGSDKSFSKFRKDKGSSFSKNDKYKKSDKPFGERKSYDKDSKFEKKPRLTDGHAYNRESKFKKEEGDKPKRSYDKSYFDKDSRDKKSYDDNSKFEKKPYSKDDKYKREDGDKPKRSYDKSYFDKKSHDEKPRLTDGQAYDRDSKHEKKSYDRDDKYKKDEDVKPRRSRITDGQSFDKNSSDKKPFYKKDGEKSSSYEKKKTYGDDRGEKRFKKDDFKEGRGFKSYDKDKKSFGDKPYKKRDSDYGNPKKHNDDGLIRLNKYLANAGISSRRDADTLILGGTVKVNGVVVDTLGYKVKPTDVVTYADSTIKNERKVYLLLNKPKDFITTTDDPQERRTVMELVRPACKERIYPVGRLDRNTTGLLLFTNDGDIATKLMHPKHEIKKVYHVTINKPMRGEDYKAVGEGITLDDGPVKVDDIAFVGEGKKEIGLEIHSGKNRIVRRIFEHLGYEVLKLDRVSYAGLTKKDLPRGKYRFLTDKEISFLKMLG